jgi:hypothetical protein
VLATVLGDGRRSAPLTAPLEQLGRDLTGASGRTATRTAIRVLARVVEEVRRQRDLLPRLSCGPRSRGLTARGDHAAVDASHAGFGRPSFSDPQNQWFPSSGAPS